MMWRGRLLAWVAPLLLLAQVALAIHQFEHRVAPDALTVTHECVLCSVASGATPPPAPFVVLPPDFGPVVHPPAVADAACCARIDAHFQSRAPPSFVAL